ncbi:MAG: NADPH-dependent FMN reductase [Candidatus Pacearchaeota archaeon]|jgi:NAD(P)H-dependent FMN reductase
MKILIIGASPRKNSYTNILADFTYKYAKEKNLDVDLLNLSETPLDYFRGYGETYSKFTADTISAIKDNYQLLILATPVYDSAYSAALKNIFEHSNYKELKGKTAGFIIMASGKISSLLVQGQLVSLMNYFGIYSNPKAVHATMEDFEGMELKSEVIQERIKELIDSTAEMAEKLS